MTEAKMRAAALHRVRMMRLRALEAWRPRPAAEGAAAADLAAWARVGGESVIPG